MTRFRAVFTLVLLVASAAQAEDWTVYEESEFQPDEYYDGDSFQIKVKTGHTYIFRLYGVDTPETDERYPDRIREQAEYFGISENRIRSWGEKATRFTERFLKRKDITVYTKKEKSGTKSSKNRYYAIIEVDGKRLDEALLEAGLARAYGMAAAYPRRLSERTFRSRLERVEAKAKREEEGIWSDSETR